MHLLKLWNNIESLLDSESPAWKKRIFDMKQVKAVQDRRGGKTWEDDEVFVAVLEAVLSGGVDWSIVENRVLPYLDGFLRSELRPGSFLESYSNLTEEHLETRWRNWFDSRQAVPRWGMSNLVRMREATRNLATCSRESGCAEKYFKKVLEQCNNDVKLTALCLGDPYKKDETYKLPSLGIPLAAEALKNLGFDVAKPDQHMCRTIAAFGLVDFSPGQTDFGPPTLTRPRQLKTMTKVEEIAEAVGKPVAYVDNAIWMLGARSGLHLTNQQLAELAGNNLIQHKDMNGLLALLDSWAKNGDVQEQKETLEYLIQALDENRPEGYKLFPPELKGKTW